MDELVKNFLQYLSQQKCKDIAVFNTTIDGQNTNSIIVSMPNVIDNKKLADKIMQDFDFDTFPEGYSKGEWIIFDFDKVVLNCFIPSVREKFNLEKLWQKEKVENIIKEVVPQKEKSKRKVRGKTIN